MPRPGFGNTGSGSSLPSLRKWKNHTSHPPTTEKTNFRQLDILINLGACAARLENADAVVMIGFWSPDGFLRELAAPLPIQAQTHNTMRFDGA